MTSNRLSAILRILWFSTLVGILVYVIFTANSYLISRSDFVGLFTGARIIMSDLRFGLYDINLQKIFQQEVAELRGVDGFIIPFRNPPTLALFFVPFAAFPLSLGYQIFAVINLFLLILAENLIQKELRFKKRDLLRLVVFTFIPTITSIVVGQVSIALLILFILIFGSLKGKKHFFGGMLASFLYNKPQYLVFVPFGLILAKKRKEFLKGFLVGLFGFLSISIFLVGTENFLKYLPFIFSTELPHYATDPANLITISSFFTT